MDPLTIQLFRIDPLTGCNNFLSFVEKLDELASAVERSMFSLLVIDMNYMDTLNATKGHLYGDSALRWMELVLREESQTPTYRIGGDEFAALLIEGSIQDHETILHNIFARLTREAPPLGIPEPVASIALVQFDPASDCTPLSALRHMDYAIHDVKTKRGRSLQTYNALELSSYTQPREHRLDTISLRLVRSFLQLGRLLDEAQQVAYIDSTSGLPNFRAAMHKLEQMLFGAHLSNETFSILLMDGDNLRLYNEISYAAGDEMIRRMSAIFTSQLRPGDFVARWRAGDEFIAILPGTHKHGACVVGDRIRNAIKTAAADWEFPTSISVGIVTFPEHGTTVNTLIDKAEAAMKHAKDLGKDQAFISA